MTQCKHVIAVIPTVGYIRLPQLIGQTAVSAEEAAANKAAGRRGPRRSRVESAPILPWSRATLWRKVKSGDFVAPVKLSEGVTAWRVEDVRAWLDARGAA